MIRSQLIIQGSNLVVFLFRIILVLIFLSLSLVNLQAEEWPMAGEVEPQPLVSHLLRIREALDVLGSPLPVAVSQQMDAWNQGELKGSLSDQVQKTLDPFCLVGLDFSDSGQARGAVGKVKAELMEQGWQVFLIKVVNRVGSTGRLRMMSPNAWPIPNSPADQVDQRWMQWTAYEGRPMQPNLSGLELEYRIVQIYSRDAGKKSALLKFGLEGHGEDSPQLVKRWTFDSDLEGWMDWNDVSLSVQNGYLVASARGGDPYIGARVDSGTGRFILRFWGQAEKAGVGQVFWWTESRPYPDGAHQVNYVVEPGREQLYEVAFDAKSPLRGVRIDPNNQTGEVRFDWIELTQEYDEAAGMVDIPVSFESRPGTRVIFQIEDEAPGPLMACIEIRDQHGQIYPAQSKRVAPDFFFQRQIYRSNGESIALPPGEYTVQLSRGPESVPETKQIVVGTDPIMLRYKVQRWVRPDLEGWWSGDHHIHAAGCLHYEDPSQGVFPSDMMRHILGEDLKVGCCLTWGPCFDFQKQFFTGEISDLSDYPYFLRYDVEISGFGSHQSGHLNLLRLSDQIYPGGDSKNHWPTLGLNALRWAKRQGAVCGPAHSSLGLTRFVDELPGGVGKEGPHGLPHYKIPAYDGIGANEFVMQVTHEVPGPNGELVPAVDFISAMDTERVAEWNMWYHVLNCGFEIAASGETDFPCLSGERVGMGRVYAQVPGTLTYPAWVEALGKGRSYVSDGSAHLMNFKAIQESSGQSFPVGSRVPTESAKDQWTFEVDVAALIPGKETVQVEWIMNGYPRKVEEVPAGGQNTTLRFRTEIRKSSWVAVRIFPNAHTNPIYIKPQGKPIRASRLSAEWLLRGVDQCWEMKRGTYAESEMEEAEKAYEHARRVYREMMRDEG